MGVLHYVPLTSSTSAVPAAAAAKPSTTTASDAKSGGATLWSNGSFGFKDLLDIVNPLQHLPVIGSVYRYLTGDEPSGGARIIGDAIFGGPIGFGTGVVSAMLTDSKGHDLGERALAAVFGPPSSDGPIVGTPTIANNNVPPAAAPLQTARAAVAAVPQAAPAVAAQDQPVRQPVGLPVATPDMAGLFRSAPAAAPAATPEQAFLAQAASVQRQAANGQTLNNRAVPLELTSNLLPVSRPAARPAAPAQPTLLAPPVPATATPASSTPAAGPADPAPAANGSNPIAQKMLDALTKYQQLKKAEEQGDSAQDPAPPKVDLSL